MIRDSAISNVEIIKACATTIEGRSYDFAPGEKWLVTEDFGEKLIALGYATRLRPRGKRLVGEAPANEAAP